MSQCKVRVPTARGKIDSKANFGLGFVLFTWYEC